MPHSDRGSGTILNATLIMVIAVGTLLTAWGIGWISSYQRAGRTADLAAIAGAQAAVAGSDGCSTARDVARRQRATVINCILRGEVPSFVLVVTVHQPLRPEIRFPGAPRWVQGEAAAGPSAGE